MARNALEKAFQEEMAEFNLAFLGLIARAGPDGPGFGLATELLPPLAGLGIEQRRQLARAPCLLAGFSPELLGAQMPALADRAPNPVSTDPATAIYASGLLTWLWQLYRHSPVLAGLYTGAAETGLGALGLNEVQRRASLAAHFLQARFCRHPCFWPDLLAALLSDDPERIAVARLSALQLGLARSDRPPPARTPLLQCADHPEV